MSAQQKFYAQADAELQMRKAANKNEREKRLAAVCAKLPEYNALRARLADTGAVLARLFFAGEEGVAEKINRLAEENLGIQRQMEALLENAGYPRTYLDEAYYCAVCKDTGVRDNARCGCFMEIVRRLASAEVNKTSPIKLCGFGSFDLSLYPDETDQALGINIRRAMRHNMEFCMKYAEDFHLPCDGILMRGKTGLGKTHLSLSIANEVLKLGYSVIYGSAPDLFRKVEREHFGREAVGETELLHQTNLLIIDDLGAEFDSPFYQSVLYNLINTRFNSGYPTIVSTNCELSELQKRYGDRTTSRLLTMETLVFCGRDIRIAKKFGR